MPAARPRPSRAGVGSGHAVLVVDRCYHDPGGNRAFEHGVIEHLARHGDGPHHRRWGELAGQLGDPGRYGRPAQVREAYVTDGRGDLSAPDWLASRLGVGRDDAHFCQRASSVTVPLGRLDPRSDCPAQVPELGLCGAREGNRTPDLRITSALRNVQQVPDSPVSCVYSHLSSPWCRLIHPESCRGEPTSEPNSDGAAVLRAPDAATEVGVKLEGSRRYGPVVPLRLAEGFALPMSSLAPHPL